MTNHLDAIRLRLSHERERLANAKTDYQRACRTIWVRQLEKEIAAELDFLGLPPDDDMNMSDAALLAELGVVP